MTGVSPWWLGVTTDHLREDCPARVRSLPTLQRHGWDGEGFGTVDPDDADVCGWCARVWRARQVQP